MRSMSKEHRLGYRPDGTHWREKSNAQVEAQNSQRKFRFDLDHKKALDTCLSHEGELNDWEKEFCLSMKAKNPSYISMKQNVKLYDILEKVS